MIHGIEKINYKATEKSIAEEVEPLIKEYFLGEVRLSGNKIYYTLPNGQEFCIAIKNCALQS